MKDNWATNLIELFSRGLDALSTRGGAIFLLFATCCGLAAMVLHVMHHGDTGEAASLVRTTFAGFTGALLLALKTGTEKASGQHDNGNGHAPDPQPMPTRKLPTAL